MGQTDGFAASTLIARQAAWEERWKHKKSEPMPAADPWLVRQRHLFNAGQAIDLACGRGRNSLFIAKAGYRVQAIDNAPSALEMLNKTASQQNLPIETLQYNLEKGFPSQCPEAHLLLCFYYLQRKLFPAIKERILSGGLFIGRSFCQLEKSATPSEIIFEPGELAELFVDWEILAYEEGEEPSKRGGTLAGIVARKP
ncbi:MAG: methyltransferase domain-containing protein [Geopsychrobacter sp.]|nr:methyltransferase domain-containing protein [Geopsychrobacter sp.]